MGTGADCAADRSDDAADRIHACPTTNPKSAKQVDQAARAPRLGSQLRFDLSADALRYRRGSKTTSHP